MDQNFYTNYIFFICISRNTFEGYFKNTEEKQM